MRAWRFASPQVKVGPIVMLPVRISWAFLLSDRLRTCRRQLVTPHAWTRLISPPPAPGRPWSSMNGATMKQAKGQKIRSFLLFGLFLPALAGCAPALSARTFCEDKGFSPKLVGTPPSTIASLERSLLQIRDAEAKAKRQRDGRRAGGLRDAGKIVERILLFQASALHEYPYQKRH